MFLIAHLQIMFLKGRFHHFLPLTSNLLLTPKLQILKPTSTYIVLMHSMYPFMLQEIFAILHCHYQQPYPFAIYMKKIKRDKNKNIIGLSICFDVDGSDNYPWPYPFYYLLNEKEMDPVLRACTFWQYSFSSN